MTESSPDHQLLHKRKEKPLSAGRCGMRTGKMIKWLTVQQGNGWFDMRVE